MSTFIEKNKPKSLRCGFYKWIINEYGEILPCAFFPSDLFKLGDITDKIETVFTIEKFREMKT